MNKLPLDVIDAIYERTDKIVALAFTMQGCVEQREPTEREISCLNTLLEVIIDQAEAVNAIIFTKEQS